MSARQPINPSAQAMASTLPAATSIRPNPSSVVWSFQAAAVTESIQQLDRAFTEADARVKATAVLIEKADQQALYWATCIAQLP